MQNKDKNWKLEHYGPFYTLKNFKDYLSNEHILEKLLVTYSDICSSLLKSWL